MDSIESIADALLQNAMNAAEITDKLGLHSLRQRAWVSILFVITMLGLMIRPVHPIHMRYLR